MKKAKRNKSKSNKTKKNKTKRKLMKIEKKHDPQYLAAKRKEKRKEEYKPIENTSDMFVID